MAQRKRRRKGGIIKKKTSRSRVAHHKIRFSHAARTHQAERAEAESRTDNEALKKGSFTGAPPSPSAILLTGMTTVPRRTIILDRQADIKWAGSRRCQEKEASQKVQICPETQRRAARTGSFRAAQTRVTCSSAGGARSAYVCANLYLRRWRNTALPDDSSCRGSGPGFRAAAVPRFHPETNTASKLSTLTAEHFCRRLLLRFWSIKDTKRRKNQQVFGVEMNAAWL